MKKAFDQTVRDLKREVNKKVLKVPSIEQKVLDATSNEPWGPHGSILADIAQSTRNYHEYQMIMSVIWKRINDTGKNWRHVYKALVVLDYLVAHGSERVIDDIREHAYQISTLSDFQYIDSSGRDQGNNVRKKSQSLVVLVSDKERIQEARQKAAANRDKFRGNQAGIIHRPGSFSSSGYGDRYDDEHYEGRYRDDERNGYGKGRDWGSRDDDRYGRYGDSYSRDGDRYSRDAEGRYGRESSRDDDYRGRSQSVDDYNYISRGRSADGYRNATEDDAHYSSRGSGAKVDDHSQDGRSLDKKLDRNYSGQSTGAPPSYEDAVASAQSPSYVERNGESSVASISKVTGASPSHGAFSTAPPAGPGSLSENASDPARTVSSPPAPTQPTVQPGCNEVDAEEFDPRSLLPAGQSTTPETDVEANLTSGIAMAAAQALSTIDNQSFDDPFGGGPFKAVPSAGSVLVQQHFSLSSNSLNTSSNQVQEVPPIPLGVAEISGPSYDATYVPPAPPGFLPPTITQLLQQELPSPIQDVDILADVLPPAPAPAPVHALVHEAQPAYPIPVTQPLSHNGFVPEPNQPQQSGLAQSAPQNGRQTQTGQPASFPVQHGQPSTQKSHALMSSQSMLSTGFANQAMGFSYQLQTDHYSVGFPSQSVAAQASQMVFPQPGSVQPMSLTNPNMYGAYSHQPISAAAYVASPSSTGLAIQNNIMADAGSAVPMDSQIGLQVPQSQSGSITVPGSVNLPLVGSSGVLTQPSEDKFKTKSSVWADTLSRGLVNLNISGPKANPLADIGVDFDAINRKEKRMEKTSTTTVASTITMGKAMGAGSGIGRAGAGTLRPPQNLMVGSALNMGMAAGVGLGGNGVSQPVGRGLPMNVNMNMGQGMNLHQPLQFPPGTVMPGGGYNMGGAGNYAQPPYGGGYR